MTVSSELLLLTTVLLISYSVMGYCQEHGHIHKELYVKSTSTQQCPQHHQCHTLLSYLQNGTTSFTSNTTLHFLPGNHSAAVPQPMTLVISNISNLALRGPEVGPDEPAVAHIWCNYIMQLQFTNANNVSLKGLAFQQCGIYNQLSQYFVQSCVITESMVLSDVPSALLFESVDSIALENVYIIHSNGFGLVAWNCFGNVSIYNSEFSYSAWKIFSNALYYYNMSTLPTGQINHLQVFRSTFGYGSGDCYLHYNKHTLLSAISGGLSIIVNSEAGLSDIIITVSNCTFHNNQALSGANMMVSVKYSQQLPHVYISILNSSFINGTARYNGGGLYLNSLYSSSISNSTFAGNSAHGSGGGLYVYGASRWNYGISVHNTTFSWNRAGFGGGACISQVGIVATSYVQFSQNEAWTGGGMCIPLVPDEVLLTNWNYLIQDSIFYRNMASLGAALDFYVESTSGHTWIYIVHCNIMENYAEDSAALNIVIASQISNPVTVFLNKTNIIGNKASKTSAICLINDLYQYIFFFIDTTCIYNNTVGLLQHHSAVIKLHNVKNCWINETKFIDNTGSSIMARNSNISLTGHVEFSGNTAYAGAAILLDCYDDIPSFLTLLPNTTVTITNNTALYYGGGIAVNQECDYGDYCFFQLPYFDENSTVAYFDNNNAGIAGNSIYGPSVSQCKMMDGELGEQVLLTLFRIEDGFSSDQVVLAQIYSVCFCEVIPTELTCSTVLDKDAYPGEEFSGTAFITGQLNDTSHGFVRAYLITAGDSSGQLGTSKLQDIQELGRSCDHQLTYSVMTTAKTALIELKIEDTPNAPYSYINITILQCPLGFVFDNGQRQCDCNEYLRSKLAITCDITREAIDVPGNVWIGNLSNNRLGAHQHCPFEYCNPEPHSIHLSNQYQQCTSNRSGVLCGACNSGFSLALGTARCLDNCSHYYLFLIIPFALAGLAVVFILLKCNLTVSMGTTNALIFYANIIHTNCTIFLPQSNVSIITRFLAVFIAWLNLDLGIETCLYRGMTAYANTWLQFVFPVYIWLLVLIMIYSSRYSVTAAKLIGRNAVSVLATLFLLSYAKLLHTTIAVVSPISIEDEDRKVYLLWLMDGNVSYFSAPHAVLIIIALVAILLYIVPLTLLTLLAPYLQARTSHRVMRWVTRIKPLLDAYQGPYKDNYRYWTGVMFIQRIVLFIVFAANTVGNPNINLFVITVTITLANIYQIYKGRLYKKKLNWFLEGFYSVNLAIFVSAVLFLKGSQRSREYLACVMVGSVFIVFCLTVIWHINYQTTVISRAVKKMKYHLGNQRRRQAEGPQEATDPPPPSRQPQPTVSVIDMRELREPLLTDN